MVFDWEERLFLGGGGREGMDEGCEEERDGDEKRRVGRADRFHVAVQGFWIDRTLSWRIHAISNKGETGLEKRDPQRMEGNNIKVVNAHLIYLLRGFQTLLCRFLFFFYCFISACKLSLWQL